jgi:hypothetical protein
MMQIYRFEVIEMTLKAIETQYKGYRFRSRLEARWAVFFDSLGIEWDFEKEGFELPNGNGRYLPDFYLPRWDYWVEVKGSMDQFQQDAERIAWFVDYGNMPGAGLVILGPIPDVSELQPSQRIVHPLLTWAKGIALSYVAFGSIELFRSKVWEFASAPDLPLYPYPDHQVGKNHQDDSKHLAAYRAARSARFEFGEAGR